MYTSIHLTIDTEDIHIVVMQKGICTGYQVGVLSLDANANGNVEK